MTPGEVFGHLTVLELLTGAEAGRPNQGTQVRVVCVCGKRRTLPARRVVHGHFKSCGCRHPLWTRRGAFFVTEKGWAAA